MKQLSKDAAAQKLMRLRSAFDRRMMNSFAAAPETVAGESVSFGNDNLVQKTFYQRRYLAHVENQASQPEQRHEYALMAHVSTQQTRKFSGKGKSIMYTLLCPVCEWRPSVRANKFPSSENIHCCGDPKKLKYIEPKHTDTSTIYEKTDLKLIPVDEVAARVLYNFGDPALVPIPTTFTEK